MRSTLSVACFHLCQCGFHGKIVFCEGQFGPNCYSKEGARITVERSRKLNLIDDSEVAMLMGQINQSGIPERDIEDDLNLHKADRYTKIFNFFFEESDASSKKLVIN